MSDTPQSDAERAQQDADEVAFAAAVETIVRAELASIGGHMLAAYGDNPDPKARTLAAVGGYLLGRFGDGDPTEETP